MPTSTTVHELTHDQIHPGPNLRTDVGDTSELEASILGAGLIVPMTVRKNENGYELVAGERRWTAIGNLIKARKLKKDVAWPVYVVAHDDAQVTVDMVVENLHRAGLTPIEELTGMLRLVNDHAWTPDQIGKATGIPVATVKARLALAKLPDHVLEAVGKRTMTLQDAGDLAKLSADDIVSLTKKNKVPGYYDIRALKDRKERDTKARKITKQLVAKGHLVVPRKDWSRYEKNPADAPPAIAAKMRANEEAAKATETARLDRKYVNSGQLEEYITALQPGEIFELQVESYGVQIHHHRVYDAASAPVGEPVPAGEDTDWDRAIELAEQAEAALQDEWERQRQDAIAQYVQTTKPSQIIAEVLAERIDRLEYTISNNYVAIEKMCEFKLGEFGAPDVIAHAKKSANGMAKVILAASFFGYNHRDIPGFDTPKPQFDGWPLEVDYTEDGTYVGPPTRDSFESDEEFEAATKVYQQARTFEVGEDDDEDDEQPTDFEAGIDEANEPGDD